MKFELRSFLFPLFLLAAVPSFGQPRLEDAEAIRHLIQRFADFRNAHNGPAVAALYSEDGEYLARNGASTHGRQALADFWAGVLGRAERIIESTEFLSGNIAVARVAFTYPEYPGTHHESFVVVLEAGEWHIRLHQTVD